jgi:hypothetical protein
MNDPNSTVDIPSGSAEALHAGLAAGFGPPRSSLGDMRPVLLKDSPGSAPTCRGGIPCTAVSAV